MTNADLMPAVARLLGWHGDLPDGRVNVSPPAQLRPGAVKLPTELAGAVVVLVDGLGFHQLRADDVDAPLLADLAGDQEPIRAVLPSTTATNLTAIGTGLHGGQHGVLGYTMVMDHVDGPDQAASPTVFNSLVWRFGLRGGGFDARSVVVPETLTPRPTMFEALAEAGVEVTVVTHPAFLDSGLTRVGLRGGRRVAARGLEATLETAVAAVVAAKGHGRAGLAYCHHPDVDLAGHGDGPFSRAWHTAVTQFDTTLRRVAATLPDDIAIVVVSDHGMVAVPDDSVLELHDDHPLLEGVALVAGEPRMRTLVVEDVTDPAVVAQRWREELGSRATVVLTPDAVADGWFGPDVPPAHARRLGDVLIASHVGAVVHPRVDPHGGRLAGMHGSLTAAERDVPAFVVTRESLANHDPKESL